MQDTCVWFNLDMVPKQLVTSIKNISLVILPCHVDNGSVGCIFHSSTKYLGSMSTWQRFGCSFDECDAMCYMYDLRLNSLMKLLYRSSENTQVFKLHATWDSKIFVYSSRKLWFNKSWDHIAQRGPWESLWSSSWLCIFISWSHLCLYPYIYVGAVFPLYQKVFKDLPCFFSFPFFFNSPQSNRVL